DDATLTAVGAGKWKGPIGLGFRVPMLVLSPFTVGGFVCSDVFDHTSTLRFIERRFGVTVPNLSHWRRSITGDMTSAINFAGGSRPTPPAATRALPAVSETIASLTRVAVECPADALLDAAQDPQPYPVPPNHGAPAQERGRAKRPSGIVRC